ncbi:MAG: VanW family protein [Patescibacteria group bacterium]|jgi:vancomycin resistance protein YoaR
MEKKKADQVNNHSLKSKKSLIIIGGIILFLIIFFTGIFAAYSAYYSDKVLPKVMIGSIKLSGKNQQELHETLVQKSKEIENETVILKYQDREWKKSLSDLGIDFDISKAEKEAMLVGHHPDFLKTIYDQTRCLFFSYKIKVEPKDGLEDLRTFIASAASEIDEPEKNASLTYENDQLKIVPETSGKRLNQATLIDNLVVNLKNLEKSNIILTLNDKKPDISAVDIENTKTQVEKYLSDDLTLSFENRKFVAIKNTQWSWLTFTPKGKNLEVSFDEEKMKAWITEKIALKIDNPVKEARLKKTGDKIVVFQEAEDGVVVDQDRLVKDIIDVLNKGEHQVAVNTTVSKAKVQDLSGINSLYFNDLVGTGTTNFIKSPNNRVHNIEVGASRFDGILIKPGEELSVVQTLGAVDASTGYLPELVIKEDGTKPEYGGGLCQVSTTFFRAALNAGLEITERTNHRYRVSYYEPPVGMDATVYLPKPDLKMKNTYNDYLLVQTKVENYSITFNIYGRTDNRKVTISDPVVYDITPAPDPQYVETDTLCKGETKKLESSHDGAKASFEYKVMDSSGKEINSQKFSSSYVPWQAKYLVGTKEGEGCPPPE